MGIDKLLEQDKSFCGQYIRLQQKIDRLETDYERLKAEIERQVYNDFGRFLKRELPQRQKKISDWKVQYFNDLIDERDGPTKIIITHFDSKEIWRGFDGELFLVPGNLPKYANGQVEIAKTFGANYSLEMEVEIQEERWNPGSP